MSYEFSFSSFVGIPSNSLQGILAECAAKQKETQQLIDTKINSSKREREWKKYIDLKETSCSLLKGSKNVSDAIINLHSENLKGYQPVDPVVEIQRDRLLRNILKQVQRIVLEDCCNDRSIENDEKTSILQSISDSFEKWLFERLDCKSDQIFFPCSSEFQHDYDQEFCNRLASFPGITDSVEICRQILRVFHRSYLQLQRSKSSSGGKICKSVNGNFYHLRYAKQTVKISKLHYEKLRHLVYVRTSSCASKQSKDIDSLIFVLLMRYVTSQGTGNQAACPHALFDVLETYFPLQMECFASPLNCRSFYYCSAFPDTDTPFGSIGSFFQFFPTSGAYQANPPFIPRVIQAMRQHMEDLLSNTKDKLTFVVIVPRWSKLKVYQDLMRCKYGRFHVTMKAKDHGYFDGAQHRRDNMYRAATCDTTLLVLQNHPLEIDIAKFRSDVRKAFESMHREEIQQSIETKNKKRKGKKRENKGNFPQSQQKGKKMSKI